MKQELLGEFVNLQAGSIYWAFDRNKHVQPVTIDRKYPVYIGQDFNIANMSNVYMQYIDGTFYVTKENILTENSANTYTAAQAIVTDLAKYQKFVIPDSTGRARKTSSSTSDHQILKDHGLTVMDTHNPLIRDRQNTVNVLFKAGKLVIDPSCGHLIKELESLATRDDEGKVSHLAVSMGYVVYKLQPLKPKRQKSKTIQPKLKL